MVEEEQSPQAKRAKGEIYKWLDEVLIEERRSCDLEMKRRHSLILLECAQQEATWLATIHRRNEEKGEHTDRIAVADAWTGLETPSGSEGFPIPSANSPSGISKGQDSEGTALSLNAENGAMVRETSMESFIDESGKKFRRVSTPVRSGMGGRRKGLFKEEVNVERWSHRLVADHRFELVFAVLIVLNSFVLAFEAQYYGLGTGHALKYSGFHVTKEDAWPAARLVFIVLDWVFGFIFTIEIVMKAVALRCHFWERWNVFDALIVIFWCLDAISRDIVPLPIDVMLLRLCRLTRLLRLVKLARTIQGFDALFLMVTTLKGSVVVLFWAGLLLFVCLAMFAFLLNQMLVNYYMENESVTLAKRQLMFQYFGTFTRSIFSMFELTLGNYVIPSRILFEDVSEWFILLSLVYKLSFGFSVLAVINGSFIQEVFKVAASDDHIMVVQKERAMRMHAKKMRKFFSAADTEGDGTINKEEFHEILQNKQIKTWLAAQELDPGDADRLFILMDHDDASGDVGLGELTADELVAGVSRLKGAARSLDLHMLMHHQTESNLQLHKELQQIIEMTQLNSRAIRRGSEVTFCSSKDGLPSDPTEEASKLHKQIFSPRSSNGAKLSGLFTGVADAEWRTGCPGGMQEVGFSRGSEDTFETKESFSATVALKQSWREAEDALSRETTAGRRTVLL